MAKTSTTGLRVPERVRGDAGPRTITWRGVTASYTADELASLRDLPGTPEGRRVAEIVHEAKALLDAELVV